MARGDIEIAAQRHPHDTGADVNALTAQPGGQMIDHLPGMNIGHLVRLLFWLANATETRSQVTLPSPRMGPTPTRMPSGGSVTGR